MRGCKGILRRTKRFDHNNPSIQSIRIIEHKTSQKKSQRKYFGKLLKINSSNILSTWSSRDFKFEIVWVVCQNSKHETSHKSGPDNIQVIQKSLLSTICWFIKVESYLGRFIAKLEIENTQNWIDLGVTWDIPMWTRYLSNLIVLNTEKTPI